MQKISAVLLCKSLNVGKECIKIYAECIIPKGSKYYEGKFIDNDAYASDKLTYVKIIG